VQITAVPQCVADFQAARPDVSVIGLMSHAGVNVDLQLAAAAGVVGAVDFIIGAHTHTPMFINKQSPCLAYNVTTSTCTCDS
jgi:2',3'-cyclic-nucleotide 2'-phosphodiesterase (5'-nucleotidase family)